MPTNRLNRFGHIVRLFECCSPTCFGRPRRGVRARLTCVSAALRAKDVSIPPFESAPFRSRRGRRERLVEMPKHISCHNHVAKVGSALHVVHQGLIS